MNAIVVALNEKVLVERHAAIRTGIELDHPTTHAVGIELLIPRRIKRVGEIDSLTIAGDFHHLRTARERLIRFLWMRRAIYNSTNAHGASLLWLERIRHVVLQEFARSEARNVK